MKSPPHGMDRALVLLANGGHCEINPGKIAVITYREEGDEVETKEGVYCFQDSHNIPSPCPHRSLDRGATKRMSG